MTLTDAFILIGGLATGIGFFWNIADRAKKQGIEAEQFSSLKLSFANFSAALTEAREEIKILRVLVDRQQEEISNLRRELREKGKI